MENLKSKKILVIGAGPVGLSAALFLSFNGLNPRIIEKLPQRVIQSRALLINPRSLELFGKYGAAEALVQNSYRLQGVSLYTNSSRFAHIDFKKEKINAKYPFLSVQEQAESERELASLLNSRKIFIERGSSVFAIKNTDDGKVEVEMEKLDGEKEISKFDFVFSADGAHSIVRKSLGLDFPGTIFGGEPWSLYDLKLETKLNPNEIHANLLNRGQFLFIVRVKDDYWRVFSNSSDVFKELPKDTFVKEVVWDAKYRISHRVIEKFNFGNIYFGGDAAHVHSPVGGRGMNLGIEDAFVFTELLIQNRLDEYNFVRGKAVKPTVERIFGITNILVGKTLFSKIIRFFARIIIPLVLPFVKKNMINFVCGMDHELYI